MLRRSFLFRQTGEYLGNTSRRAYEQNYRENLRMKAAFWDKTTGRFTPIPATQYVWSRFSLGIKILLVFVFGFTFYGRIVNWTSRFYQTKFDGMMQNREDYLVSTGKLKHPKYYVDPMRQIDDPDANNVPCFTIHDDDDGVDIDKKVFSKSFHDEYYEDDLHADKRKWQKGASISIATGGGSGASKNHASEAKKNGPVEVGPHFPPGVLPTSAVNNEEEEEEKENR